MLEHRECTSAGGELTRPPFSPGSEVRQDDDPDAQGLHAGDAAELLN